MHDDNDNNSNEPSNDIGREMRLDDDHRLVTETRMREIYTRLANMAKGGGQFELRVHAMWRGSLRWARNRVSMASDERDIELVLARNTPYGKASIVINQVDDTSLANAMTAVERLVNLRAGTGLGVSGGDPPFYGRRLQNPLLPYPETAIWSEKTFNVLPEQRAQLSQTLMQGAETKDMLSAGYVEMQVSESQRFGDKFYADPEPDWRLSNESPQGQGATRIARDEGYIRYTMSQCSMTVREPKGLGSGWAGQSGYDWSVIDSGALATRALDKCVASLNPVAVEPGRFTVILEPQAVYEFASVLVGSFGGRLQIHEDPRRPGVWSEDVDPTLGMRMTKLGQMVIDDRITITTDPMNPRLGMAPSLGLEPVTWVEKGRLRNLGYERQYALNRLRESTPTLGGPFFMSGGTTSMEEMIASTPRGLIVTRFSTLNPIWGAGLSLLYTGLTRDGLWLVEKGKITKAVKNMRFTDSPLFVFNHVLQLGMPVPVFGEGINPPIVPSMKAEDFAFTATIDAI